MNAKYQSIERVAVEEGDGGADGEEGAERDRGAAVLALERG